MAKRTYRTASGKMVDMDTLALKNETVIAVGNMNVNARGDKLGNGGRIVKSREELITDHYSVKGSTIPQKKVKSTNTKPLQSRKIVDDDPVGPMDTPAEPDPELVTKETLKMDTVNNDNVSQDDWIEDEDGNFVRSNNEATQTSKPSTKGLASALADTKSISVPFEESEKQKARKTRGVKRI